jgi:hypothetical protein
MPRKAFHFIISRKARGYPTPSRPNVLFFCPPERSEGSLGTYAPREDREVVAPRPLSLSPRAQARGLLGDAIPNEVRDASLSLGRTGWRIRCFASLSMTGWRGMRGWMMSPGAPFFVSPSDSEGSLGACAPRNNKKKRPPERKRGVSS